MRAQKLRWPPQQKFWTPGPCQGLAEASLRGWLSLIFLNFIGRLWEFITRRNQKLCLYFNSKECSKVRSQEICINYPTSCLTMNAHQMNNRGKKEVCKFCGPNFFGRAFVFVFPSFITFPTIFVKSGVVDRNRLCVGKLQIVLTRLSNASPYISFFYQFIPRT